MIKNVSRPYYTRLIKRVGEPIAAKLKKAVDDSSPPTADEMQEWRQGAVEQAIANDTRMWFYGFFLVLAIFLIIVYIALVLTGDVLSGFDVGLGTLGFLFIIGAVLCVYMAISKTIEKYREEIRSIADEDLKPFAEVGPGRTDLDKLKDAVTEDERVLAYFGKLGGRMISLAEAELLIEQWVLEETGEAERERQAEFERLLSDIIASESQDPTDGRARQPRRPTARDIRETVGHKK